MSAGANRDDVEMNFGALSYGTGAVAFLVLSVLLVTSWRGRLLGGWLVLATAVSAVWAGLFAAQSGGIAGLPTGAVWAVEIARDAAWYVFLFHILRVARDEAGQVPRAVTVAQGLVATLCVTLLGVTLWYPTLAGLEFGGVLDVTVLNAGHVGLAVIGLILIEHLYRNTRPEQRWSVKFLCLGVGGLFAYDLFLYSHALMFRRVDPDLWQARGAVNALITPLVGVSAARNPQWSVRVFVSRGLVFHSTAATAAGIYLMTMATVGYLIRYWGADWGAAVQAIFFSGALLLLIILLFSGQLRARLRVFLNKHFFHYRYDYREEWLRLIRTLSARDTDAPLYERVIRLLAEMVESRGGALWIRRESGAFAPVSRWGIPEFAAHEALAGSPLLHFMESKEWVVEVEDLAADPVRYGETGVPEWLAAVPQGWLIVPMLHRDELYAMAVLANPRAPFELNWENIDLLRTAGRQAASHLALNEAAEALAQARQFEAFNRFSAFVMHDLKNLIAQLSLVASNAERHQSNPAFVEDAMKTVRHAVEKMGRLLQQLKTGMPGADNQRVDLRRLVEDVVRSRAGQPPAPILSVTESGIHVRADRERLGRVLGHLVQNAQEATPKNGEVRVELRREGNMAIVDVIDTGCGMDEAFIRDRLFRPFDTTKGLTGMGIGAYETRELIRALGGQLRVISAVGRGTHFEVQIPVPDVPVSDMTQQGL